MANNLIEIGVSGLTQFSGYVSEERLAELSNTKWRAVLKNMLTNDPVICSLNTVIEMLTRQVSWKLDPKNSTPEAGKSHQFFESALFQDMEMTWQETLSELITFLQWGWSFHEICYKHRKGDGRDPNTLSKFTDGKVGWRKFAGRSQDSLDRWIFDDEDCSTAMVQRSPNTGDLFTIPNAKALHFRTTAAKNNPEGRSMYRGAYRPWYFKTRIENIEAIGIERDLAGMPVMYVPEQYMRRDASPGDKALKEDLMETLSKIRRDENEGVMLPSAQDEHGNKHFELQLLSTGGERQFDTNQTINRYNAQILMTGLADFLMLGQQKVGSFALSSDKTQLFATSLEAHLDSICDKFNNEAIPDLAKLNAMDLETLPSLKHGSVDKIPLQELCDAVQKLSGAGVTFDEDQQNWLKGQVNMPLPEATNEK